VTVRLLRRCDRQGNGRGGAAEVLGVGGRRGEEGPGVHMKTLPVSTSRSTSWCPALPHSLFSGVLSTCLVVNCAHGQGSRYLSQPTLGAVESVAEEDLFQR